MVGANVLTGKAKLAMCKQYILLGEIHTQMQRFKRETRKGSKKPYHITHYIRSFLWDDETADTPIQKAAKAFLDSPPILHLVGSEFIS